MELLLLRVLDRGRLGVGGVAGVVGVTGFLMSGDTTSPMLPPCAPTGLTGGGGLGMVSTRPVNATFEPFLSTSNRVGLGGGIAIAPHAGLTGALQLCLGTLCGLDTLVTLASSLTSGVAGG